MTITCPKCKTRLKLPDEKLKPEGTKFKCSKCGATLLYKGKGPQAPRGETPESPAPPPAEETAAAPQTAPAAGEARMHEDVPPPTQTGSLDVPHSAAAAEGTKPERQPEELRKTDDVSRTVPPRASDVYSPGQGTKAAPVKAIIAAVVGLLVIVLGAVFFFHSGGKGPNEQKQMTEADKGMTASTPPSRVEGPAATGDSAENATAGLPQGDGTVEQPAPPAEDAVSTKGPAATTEEEAIELVKRSDALLKRTSVESIVKIWTEKNAANYKIVGWQAKKTDEQKYLVSYTALDGDMPKGFYFELDGQSGVVTDLARNPELQKKYNILYAK